MRYYVYHAISMSFLLQASLNGAMQPVRSQKKIERTVFDPPITKSLHPTSIACVGNNIITIIDPAKYQRWNYQRNKSIQEQESMIRGTETVRFHPNKNMVFYFDPHGGFIFNFDTNMGKCFYAPSYAITAGCFSAKNLSLFMVDKQELVTYNYDTQQQHSIPLECKVGIIFAAPSENNNFFVCSSVRKNIYQIKVGKKYKEKKIFSLHKKGFVFDENHWAYSDAASLLCLINKRDKGLHIFDIKSGKSTSYQHGNDFSIVNMMFHPTNKMILILLSQDRRRIEYVDLSDFKNICSILTTEHETLGGRGIPDLLMSDQKMAISRDGEHLFVSAGSTIFNICVPFRIAHQPNLKKYQLICCLLFSPDLQKLLLWHLLLVHKHKQE